jgi:cystathionine gamma-synthase
MHLRVERASANAAELATRLATHPRVQRVRYPGMGAIVAIEVAGGSVAAEHVASATALWTHATSLGGVESLIERRRRHPSEPLTVPENLLRLSVGVEDVEDLWRDLDGALQSLESPAT